MHSSDHPPKVSVDDDWRNHSSVYTVRVSEHLGSAANPPKPRAEARAEVNTQARVPRKCTATSGGVDETARWTGLQLPLLIVYTAVRESCG